MPKELMLGFGLAEQPLQNTPEPEELFPRFQSIYPRLS